MRLFYLIVLLFIPMHAIAGKAGSVADLLWEMDASLHTEQIDTSEQAVVDHEIGLGAISKVRGVWQFKASIRLDGLLSRYTWQVKDGFTSAEILARLERGVMALDGAEMLFTCDGRACGRANEWANRVFGQRLLYGKSDDQRYRVIAVNNDAGSARVLLYSSARTEDRQYLHADYLVLVDD